MYKEDVPFISENTPALKNYMIVYKSLLEFAPALGLNLDAVYLYSLLRDRTSISAENEWADEQERVYIIYTRTQVMEETGWSKYRVINAFQALRKAGLITEEAQKNRAGCNIAPHIFVKQWAAPSLRLSLEDIKSGKLFDIDLKNAGVISDNYYILPRLPKATTFGRLSVRAKILYAIILDMMQLSLKYGNRIDAKGAWCSIDTDMAQSTLQCGHSTLTATYNELIGSDLCCREKRECGCSMRTYLRPCWLYGTEQKGESAEKSLPQLTENSQVNHPVSAPQQTEHSTQVSPTQVASVSEPLLGSLGACAPSAEQVKQRIFEQIEIEELSRDIVDIFSDGDRMAANEIVSHSIAIVVKDTLYRGNRVRLGRNYVLKEKLLDAYDHIDRSIMLDLIRNMVPKWTEIKKPKSSLREAMYHTWIDYQDKVRTSKHDRSSA